MTTFEECQQENAVLREALRWRDARTEPPENDDEIDLWNKKYARNQRGKYDEGEYLSWDNEWGWEIVTDDVTHWCPLPPPPKGAE